MVQNINSDRPQCRGVSITLWRATGHQPFGKLRARSEGEKAVRREPDAATPLSKRLWSMQMKV